MPTVFFSEAEQEEILKEHNQQFNRPAERIPLVPRNAETGWPLLQISLFSPTAEDQNSYLPVLGGGKCHTFMTEVFFFASLLTRIPGKIELFGNNTKQEKIQLKNGNFQAFFNSFEFFHKNIGLKISSKANAYGKGLEITLPFLTDSAAFDSIFSDTIQYVRKPRTRLSNFGRYSNEAALSEESINDALNHDIATFHDGQIFVDFGYLLTEKVKDPTIINYFKKMFKVDEFRQLQQQKNDFKSSVEPYIEAASSYQPLSDEKIDKLFTDFDNAIAYLRRYGNLIKREENLSGMELFNSPGYQAGSLADSLKEEIDNFKYLLRGTYRPTREQVEGFESRVKDKIREYDDIMKTHRKIWKPIVANLLLAVATLGVALIAIAVKSGTSAQRARQNGTKLYASDCLFFAKTKREELVERIENAFDSDPDFQSVKNQLK